MKQRPFYLQLSTLMALITLPLPALASDPTGLMVIFLPGLVFIVVGTLAISYALTTTIQHYWLQFALRVFSVALVVSPMQVVGANYWWPNIIAFFFNEHFNVLQALIHSIIITAAIVLTWWIVKNQPRI